MHLLRHRLELVRHERRALTATLPTTNTPAPAGRVRSLTGAGRAVPNEKRTRHMAIRLWFDLTAVLALVISG